MSYGLLRLERRKKRHRSLGFFLKKSLLILRDLKVGNATRNQHRSGTLSRDIAKSEVSENFWTESWLGAATGLYYDSKMTENQ